MCNKRVCATCKYNEGITSPPSPGGPQDGLNCSHPLMIKRYGTLEEKATNINIWRVEVIDPIEGCEQWEEKPGEDPEIIKERTHATEELSASLKILDIEVDYWEGDWKDSRGLADGVHDLCHRHPGWSMYYFSGDTWGIDSNYVFFISKEVGHEVVEKIGDFISEGAVLPGKASQPNPECPKCGAPINDLTGFYAATVVGYVKLDCGQLSYGLDDDVNDLKDIIDEDNVSWHCPVCNEELFRAGEECEEEILALFKCEQKGI